MNRKHEFRKLYNTIVDVSRLVSKFTNPDLIIFNKTAKKIQRERALFEPENELSDYLKEEVSYRLYDNLLDIKREFSRLVDLNCGRGHFSKRLTNDLIKEVIMCDTSSIILDRAVGPKDVKCQKIVVDDENLNFENNSIDIFVSCLSLHWINDLPGLFVQILSKLKNDGVFLASMFGNETLYELRSSLQLADLERRGGVSPHISPFARVRDIGGLLTAAGFTMLTIDTDEITVGYPSIFELMWDLKSMGENNAAINRCTRLDKDVMLAASAIYENMYGENENIRATFQLINFIAWKPDPSQPQPLPRGNYDVSLKDLKNLDEIVTEKGFINLDEDDNKKK